MDDGINGDTRLHTLIRNGLDGLGRVVLGRHVVTSARLHRLTLHVHLDAGLLGLLLQLGVLLDAVQEVVAALAMLDVLNANIDALGDDSVAHALVHDHADGGLGDVVDDAGFSINRPSVSTSIARYARPTSLNLPVVELERHTTVLRRVTLDVHDVADLVRLHVRGQVDRALLAEIAREEVARARAQTKRVRHFSTFRVMSIRLMDRVYARTDLLVAVGWMEEERKINLELQLKDLE